MYSIEDNDRRSETAAIPKGTEEVGLHREKRDYREITVEVHVK